VREREQAREEDVALQNLFFLPRVDEMIDLGLKYVKLEEA
jgi:hypothetical protein